MKGEMLFVYLSSGGTYVNDGKGWRPLYQEQPPSPMQVDAAIEFSECPCDPRRRHERLGQKVAVV